MNKFSQKKTGLWTKIDLNNTKTRVKYWIVFSLMVIISAVCIFPSLWILMSSFKSVKEMLSVPPTLFPKSFDISKLAMVWEKIDFTRYYVNTVIMSLGELFVCIVSTGFAGYVISRLKPKGASLVFTLFLWTMLLPHSMGMVPLFMTFIDFPLLHINLTNTYVPMWIIAGANAYYILLFKSFFDSIDAAFIEAAKIDGCGDLGIFAKIILPLSKPVIMVVSIFTVNHSWDNFLWPYLLIKDQSMLTVPVKLFMMKSGWPIDVYIVSLLFGILPPAVIFAIFQKHIIGGLTVGGIKG